VIDIAISGFIATLRSSCCASHQPKVFSSTSSSRFGLWVAVVDWRKIPITLVEVNE